MMIVEDSKYSAKRRGIHVPSFLKMKDQMLQMSLRNARCTRCHQEFQEEEEIVNSNGQIWHKKCFVLVVEILIISKL